MNSITSFSELRSAIWRQAWLILLVVALGLPAVYWYAKTRPKVYEAVGTLGLEGPEGALAIAGSAPDVGTARRLDEVQQVLMSRDNLKGIAERFDLYPGNSEALRVALTRISISFNKLADPAQPWRTDIQPYGLSIAVRLDDPAKAAAIANALLDAAVAEDARLTRARQAASLEHMAGVLGYLLTEERRVGEEIATVESEIAQYRVAKADSLPENLRDQREHLAELEEQRRSLEAEIAEIERTQVQRRSDAVERRRAQLTVSRDDLLEEIEDVEAAIEAVPDVERELGAMTRRLQNLETELGAIVMQRTQAVMSQSLANENQGAGFTVTEAAMPPEYAISKSRSKLAVLGAAGVGALALGLAVAREVLNPVIRTAAQMQKQLGVAPVVVVPYVTRRTNFLRRLGFGTAFLGVLVLAAVTGPGVRAAPEANLHPWPDGVAERLG